MIKTLTVFDPAMCCSTGVCGTDIDQVLVDFSADVQWLKQRGIQVDRYNLAQQPMSFVQNVKAKAFLEASGAEGLPLLLLDEEMVMAGRYPKRADLARWFGIPLEKVGLTSKSCCGSNTSCC
ncbi:arsenical resistance operon trans-acting repressor [Yersinia aleksiciae]|uniref:Arsenical resistance operon trans-acting repressor n=1 Tax=Yersinia aleksiciae TaxID=263819 RepID=A0A0T9T8M4_YERAE|nr:arsenical resistance operon trans-acting repressor [Yersinia aleksiciae]CNK66250.1 arsenical resistance operon trans-acting repressor [Yersinia aleksiciae]